jgi:hypothetical protein
MQQFLEIIWQFIQKLSTFHSKVGQSHKTAAILGRRRV